MRDRTDLRAAALHLASFSGDTKMIRLLLENGADMTVTTASGVSPLHMAAQGNTAIGMNMLLYDIGGYDLNSADNSGATSLIWSAFCGCEIALAYLLA